MESSKRFAARVAQITLAGFSVPASAFQPLITDDTGTQGSGGNQLELSLNEDRAEAAGNNVFAPQCLATIAAVKRETGGWTMPLIMLGYLFAPAYAASFITYRLALAMGAG